MSPDLVADSGADALISLTDAAEELGLHYMTVYRYVRTGRLYARKERGQWVVKTSDVDGLKASTAEKSPRSALGASASKRANLVEPFTERLLVGDGGGCWAIVTDALNGGATPADIHALLMQPALVTVGQRWADGHITISAEHRATSTAQRLLGRLGPLFTHPGRRRGTVVIAMVAGDAHAMPSAMLADLLANQHFEVVDLGANTPIESIIDTARECEDLVAVGVAASLESLAPALVETMRQLRAALPEARLFSGGPVAANHRSTLDEYVDGIGAGGDESAALVASFAAPADA